MTEVIPFLKVEEMFWRCGNPRKLKTLFSTERETSNVQILSFNQENMDEVCSLQLLTSVRRMVLKLTQQNDESKEFVHFFHRQLGGILQVRRMSSS